MNIGMMCHTNCGGSSKIAVELSAELVRRGHRVHLFARRRPHFLKAGTRGILCHSLHGGDNSRNGFMHLEVDWPQEELNAMVELIRSIDDKEGLQILHMHYAFPFALIGEAFKRRGNTRLPHMAVTFHGTDLSVLGFQEDRFHALQDALSLFDGMTTVSRSHADLFRRLFSTDRGPEVITDFIDFSRFSQKRTTPSRSRLRLIHISNFRPIKNVCDVIDIFSLIRAGLEAELWLVGDGEQMAAARALIEKRKIGEHVILTGLVEHIPETLGQADLLLMASKQESFCLVALEAMACGVPVIAPAVGGLPEVVLHGETGFLYPYGEHSMAADMAMRFSLDPDLYCRISASAVDWAKRFDVHDIVDRYELFYERLIHDG